MEIAVLRACRDANIVQFQVGVRLTLCSAIFSHVLCELVLDCGAAGVPRRKHRAVTGGLMAQLLLFAC